MVRFTFALVARFAFALVPHRAAAPAFAIDRRADSLVKSSAPGIVFFDTVAAAPMKAELEGTLEENARPGQRAFLLGRHLPRMLTKIDHQPIIIIYVAVLGDTVLVRAADGVAGADYVVRVAALTALGGDVLTEAARVQVREDP